MKTLLWFIFRRFVSSIEVPAFDPKGYVKDRIFTYLFSVIRLGDWVYISLSALFAVVIGIEIVLFIVSMIHDVIGAVRNDVHPATNVEWVRLTLGSAIMWVLSIILWLSGIVTRVLSVIQRISGPFLSGKAPRFGRYQFASVSWTLLLLGVIIHLITYFS